MSKTKIEWTEESWNPTTGCSKISIGCINCYAERMANRLKAMGSPKYKDGFRLKTHEECLLDPYKWRNARTVFVNSMSDLFHEKIDFDFVNKVFNVMNENPRHTFQVLTKRANVLVKYCKDLIWTKNIWMGVTVESKEYLKRIDLLRQSDAFVKFLSIEPLLDDLEEIDLHNIDWVIVGGESGPNARKMKLEWVQRVKKTCINQNVPFFFKQWGGKNKKKNGRTLDGKEWDQRPSIKWS